jgi:hypothetical protein
MLEAGKPVEQAMDDHYLRAMTDAVPSMVYTPPGSSSVARRHKPEDMSAPRGGLQEAILVCLRGLDAARLK